MSVVNVWRWVIRDGWDGWRMGGGRGNGGVCVVKGGKRRIRVFFSVTSWHTANFGKERNLF